MANVRRVTGKTRFHLFRTAIVGAAVVGAAVLLFSMGGGAIYAAPVTIPGVPPVGWTLGLCGRVMVVVVLPFVWWLLSDRGVKPAGVVPGFDPPSD